MLTLQFALKSGKRAGPNLCLNEWTYYALLPAARAHNLLKSRPGKRYCRETQIQGKKKQFSHF